RAASTGGSQTSTTVRRTSSSQSARTASGTSGALARRRSKVWSGTVIIGLRVRSGVQEVTAVVLRVLGDGVLDVGVHVVALGAQVLFHRRRGEDEKATCFHCVGDLFAHHLGLDDRELR